MQLLLNMWKRVPADKSGGTIADLSDMLLDKLLEVPSCKSYTVREGIHGRDKRISKEIQAFVSCTA